MKQVTDEQFFTAFEKADDTTKALMYSSHIYDCAKSILEAMGSSVNPSLTLTPVGHHLLGLSSSDEAVNDLQEIGITNGLEFLLEVRKKISSASDLKPVQDTLVSASEIAETEKVFENLQSIRTMASDMKEAQAQTPIYQSSQSDIIRPASSVPPITTNGPRWETDK